MDVPLVLVVLFEFITLGLSYLLSFPAFSCIKRFGVRNVLISGYIFGLLLYVLLYLFTPITAQINLTTYILFTSIITSLYGSFHWMAYHSFFILSTNKGERGKKYALVSGLPVLISIASPLVGGLLIDNVGFGFTFIVSIILLFLAIIPLFFVENTKPKERITTQIIRKGKNKSLNKAFIFEGATNIGTGFLWPILLFFFGISISIMGGLYFVSKTFYAIVTYISGIKSDKSSTKSLIRYGALGHGASMITRSFAKIAFIFTSFNPVLFAGIFQTLGGIAAPMWVIPLHSAFYKKGDNEHIINTILSRELYLAIGRLMFMGSILLAVLFLPAETALIATLILSGFTAFAFYHLSEGIQKELSD